MKVDKIQIKRGLKANLPNLDDAELGYCTDTKELYIGRGTTLTPVRIGEFDDTALRNLINTLSNTVDTIKNTVSTQGTDINNLKTGKVNIVTCTSLPSTTDANTWYLKIINSGTNIDVEIYGADKKLYRPRTDASLVTYGGTTVQSMLGNLDLESSPQVNATGSNGAYTGSTGRITSLTKGKSILLFVSTDTSGYNCTLNLNSYGIKNIRDCFGNIITSLSANIPYQLCYNGTDFILLGKGGGGNVIASQVLAGMKFTNDSGTFVGTMPSVNNPTTNLNCGGSYTIPMGYHPGTERVNANSLASQTGGATADDTKVLNGYTYWRDGALRTGNASLQSMGGAKVTNGNISTSVSTGGKIVIPSAGYIPSMVIFSTRIEGETSKNQSKMTLVCYNSEANCVKHIFNNSTPEEAFFTGYNGYGVSSNMFAERKYCLAKCIFNGDGSVQVTFETGSAYASDRNLLVRYVLIG